MFGLIFSFIFGPGGLPLGGGRSSGAEFGRMLAGTYGNNNTAAVGDGVAGAMPRFFDGAFAEVLIALGKADAAQHAEAFDQILQPP